MLQHFKDYFHFTATELRAALVLTGLVILLVLGIPFIPLLIPENQAENASLVKMADSLFAAGFFRQDSAFIETPGVSRIDKLAGFEADPYYFDPNVLDKEGWQRVGLDDKIIRTILNYRGKGGEFREPGDLKKIYGMNEEDYYRLEPYLRLPASGERVKNANLVKRPSPGSPGKPPDTLETLELNSTDTALLMQCKGIGRYYAGRIIKYRDILGGFYSKDQLLEVWGMDSARYLLFNGNVYADPSGIRRFDINSVTFRELLKHPYFEYHVVKAIFELKDKHGRIDSLRQLKEIPFMYEELYSKISPYLSTGGQAEK